MPMSRLAVSCDYSYDLFFYVLCTVAFRNSVQYSLVLGIAGVLFCKPIDSVVGFPALHFSVATLKALQQI